ncbi:MAG: hypothetical protein IT428_33720 [Planctomycetaceae bacterium]|nr:hypothetical protein [Planctomycetaceae bacterium]
MKKITTPELMSRLGFGSPQMLVHWHHFGLIPEAQVAKHPSGRGKTGYWPEWVVDRCRRVRRLQEGGMSLADIAKKLGTDWAEEERAWEERVEAESAARLTPDPYQVEGLKAQLRRELRSLIKGSGWLFDSLIGLFSRIPEQVDEAIQLMSQGYRPVLIVRRKGEKGDCTVHPDFTLGKIASCDPAKPMLIIPLFPIFEKVMSYTLSKSAGSRWELSTRLLLSSQDGKEKWVEMLKDHKFEEFPPARATEPHPFGPERTKAEPLTGASDSAPSEAP